MRGPGDPGERPTAATRQGDGAATRVASRRFPATAGSVGQARRFLVGRLPSAACDDADALVLMLSELATNAVQHAATEFEVSVRVTPDCGTVRVEVSDGAAGYPAPEQPVPEAARGRGLQIVQSLADAWGIEMRRDRPGKTVWFSLVLPAMGGAAAAGAAAEDERQLGADPAHDD